MKRLIGFMVLGIAQALTAGSVMAQGPACQTAPPPIVMPGPAGAPCYPPIVPGMPAPPAAPGTPAPGAARGPGSSPRDSGRQRCTRPGWART